MFVNNSLASQQVKIDPCNEVCLAPSLGRGRGAWRWVESKGKQWLSPPLYLLSPQSAASQEDWRRFVEMHSAGDGTRAAGGGDRSMPKNRAACQQLYRWRAVRSASMQCGAGRNPRGVGGSRPAPASRYTGKPRPTRAARSAGGRLHPREHRANNALDALRGSLRGARGAG